MDNPLITPERISTAAGVEQRYGRMVTAESVFSPVAMSAVEAMWTTYRPDDVPTGPNLEGYVMARVDHGRWVVDCPTCRTAMLAGREDERFFCTNCGNGGTHLWLTVVWPPDADEAERLLAVRPNIETRSWQPDRETLEDLENENRLHGVT